MIKIVILDRDGVINVESVGFIKTPEEWIPIPGSLEAIAQLNQAGYIVTVATNQSGIGRGLFDIPMLDRIHQRMQDALAKLDGHIDGIFYCPHLPEDNCDCRKPKTGLFKQIAAQYGFEFTQFNPKIPAIGDSLRDLQAARDAGCEPILVLTGNGKETLGKLDEDLKNIQIYNNLQEAVQHILNSKSTTPLNGFSS